MRDSCCDCKYCKIVDIDLHCVVFYCKKLPIFKNHVTGEIDYIKCTESVRQNCKNFEPTLITKILNFLGI